VGRRHCAANRSWRPFSLDRARRERATARGLPANVVTTYGMTETGKWRGGTTSVPLERGRRAGRRTRSDLAQGPDAPAAPIAMGSTRRIVTAWLGHGRSRLRGKPKTLGHLTVYGPAGRSHHPAGGEERVARARRTGCCADASGRGRCGPSPVLEDPEWGPRRHPRMWCPPTLARFPHAR